MQLVYASNFNDAIAEQEQDSRRYKKLAKIALSVFLLLSIIVPWLPVEKISREKQEALPPQLAKVLLEREKLEPPKPVVKKQPKKIKDKKKPKPEKKLEKKLEQKPKPKLQAKPIVKAPVASVQAKPKHSVQEIAQAQQVASSSGLLAMENELVAMQDDFDMAEMDDFGLTPKALAASPAKKNSNAKKTSRLGAQSSKRSGGVKSTKLSSNRKTEKVASRKSTQLVASNSEQKKQTKKNKQNSASKASRSENEIRSVLERAKAKLYTIYNRALNDDPQLQGKVVFQLTIASNGKVTGVKVISSQLKKPKLERKLSLRLKLLNFGKKSVATTKTNWAIEFLPSY